MNPGALHLLIGPVGAGKTTYARQKSARMPAVLLDCDTWMVRLFGADARPRENGVAWYLERRERCRSLIWDMALEVLRAGGTAYLELGLVSRHEREEYYVRARDEGVEPKVLLLDASREVRRERVLRRNEAAGPYTQVVPLEFFELASDAWEAPTEEERRVWGIVDV